MLLGKVYPPKLGCIVEFMHGNFPLIAYVIEEKNSKFKVYTINKREMIVPAQRFLPWIGPFSPNLNRADVDKLLLELKNKRSQIASSINIVEVLDLVRSELKEVSSEWLCNLVWSEPSVDHEAAMGSVLLQNKTMCKFNSKDFEIFSSEEVEKKQMELEASRLKESLIKEGSYFFNTLWQAYCNKKNNVLDSHLSPEVSDKLFNLLLNKIADKSDTEEEQLWRQLAKGLPDIPFLSLNLATAWKLPEHYNFHLDKIDYIKGDFWWQSYGSDVDEVARLYKKDIESSSVLSSRLPFISIDPSTSIDRDDAFYVKKNVDNSFDVSIAIAAPGFVWDFDSSLDKAVRRRASSLYFPEGDEHMLPGLIGWQMFSLDENKERLAMTLSLKVDAEGEVKSFDLSYSKIKVFANLSFEQAEKHLSLIAKQENITRLELTKNTSETKEDKDNFFVDFANQMQEFEQEDSTLRNKESQQLEESDESTKIYGFANSKEVYDILSDSYELASLLRALRLKKGAVITERIDSDLVLDGEKKDEINIKNSISTSNTQLIIAELMLLLNISVGKWALDNSVPLIYKNQDVALPKEFFGVWSNPHDITRVIKALPASNLDVVPKKNAGLGVFACTSATAPIRRYIDLINQGQVASYLLKGSYKFSLEELSDMLPELIAYSESTGQVQRYRTRYWKLVFFANQGDKVWWDGIVTEENAAFVSVSIPFANLYVRGKRSLFNEKLELGQLISVRIGKVRPLLNEISIVESRM